jgi:hypothetical protein
LENEFRTEGPYPDLMRPYVQRTSTLLFRFHLPAGQASTLQHQHLGEKNLECHVSPISQNTFNSPNCPQKQTRGHAGFGRGASPELAECNIGLGRIRSTNWNQAQRSLATPREMDPGTRLKDTFGKHVCSLIDLNFYSPLEHHRQRQPFVEPEVASQIAVHG